jgi:hypothetical protein
MKNYKKEYSLIKYNYFTRSKINKNNQWHVKDCHQIRCRIKKKKIPKKFLNIRDQLEFSTCLSMSILNQIEKLLKENNVCATLDERYTHYFAKINEQKRACQLAKIWKCGVSMTQCLGASLKYGFIRTGYLPETTNNITTHDLEKCVNMARKNKIVEYGVISETNEVKRIEILKILISQNIPINICLSGFVDDDNKIHLIKQKKDRTHSAIDHSVNLVGFDEHKQEFIYVNTWGSDWGKDGCGTLPYSYVTDQNRMEKEDMHFIVTVEYEGKIHSLKDRIPAEITVTIIHNEHKSPSTFYEKIMSFFF